MDRMLTRQNIVPHRRRGEADRGLLTLGSRAPSDLGETEVAVTGPTVYRPLYHITSSRREQLPVLCSDCACSGAIPILLLG
jgi:hypothetical protein